MWERGWPGEGREGKTQGGEKVVLECLWAAQGMWRKKGGEASNRPDDELRWNREGEWSGGGIWGRGGGT